MASQSQHGVRRREFLKSGGMLIVGFAVGGNAVTKAVLAQSLPQTGITAGPPNAELIDSWIAIHANNTATIYSGFVDLGQGGPTSLMQIAADELDMTFEQISYHTVDTSISTQGTTNASSSIGRGAPPLRAAAAEARMALLRMASQRLKSPLYGLVVSKGVVSVGGNPNVSITYGELIGDKKFGDNAKVTYKLLPKSVGDYEYVTKRVRRPDIAEKARGTYTYVQHVRLPGMLHGRVVRPRGQGPMGSGPKVLAIDPASIAHLPDVQIVHKQDFVGVVAPREWDAVRAAQQLKVTWDTPAATLPGTEGLWDYFRKATAAGKTNDDLVIDGDVSAIEKQPHVFKGTFHGPYLSHGTMAPNCAVADVTNDGAVVISTSQSPYATRAQIATVLDMPANKVRVQYGPGSCTFGISCFEDVATAAALMSQQVGKPVRLQFMRWDEFGWDNYCPPHLADVRAAVDGNGKLLAFEYTGWSHSYTNPTTTISLALGVPPRTPAQAGSSTNRLRLTQNEMYDIPVRRMLDHDVYGPGLLRGGYLRSPLDPHYFFAAEQAMDHLAYLAKIDALEFRRRNISHRRWMGVLEAAAKAANWQPRVAASRTSDAVTVTGRGIALGNHHVPLGNQEDRVTYAAAVAEVQVNRQTGLVIATHIYAAMDVGLAINPGIVENQIVGMSNHGSSIALKEEVQFSSSAVTSLDWNSYRTLRHGEAPAVTPIVVQQLLEKSSGSGEEALPAVVAAIANAVFDATGKRVYEFPMTPARVLNALKA